MLKLKCFAQCNSERVSILSGWLAGWKLSGVRESFSSNIYFWSWYLKCPKQMWGKVPAIRKSILEPIVRKLTTERQMQKHNWIFKYQLSCQNLQMKTMCIFSTGYSYRYYTLICQSGSKVVSQLRLNFIIAIMINNLLLETLISDNSMV